MNDPWVPLRFRENGVPDEHAVLVQGIPDRLRPALWRWLETGLLGLGCAGLRTFVQDMELALRRDLGSRSISRAEERYWPNTVETGKTPTSVTNLHGLFDVDDDLFWEAVDHMVHAYTVRVAARYQIFVSQGRALPSVEELHDDYFNDLSGVLNDGGSVWTAVWPFPQPAYLAHRATDVTMRRIADMASGHGREGKHLSDAWEHIFGRHPTPRPATGTPSEQSRQRQSLLSLQGIRVRPWEP